MPNTETENFFNSLYLLPGKTVIIGMDKKSTSDKKKNEFLQFIVGVGGRVFHHSVLIIL